MYEHTSADFQAVISKWQGNLMDMIDGNAKVAEQDIRNVVEQWDDNLVNNSNTSFHEPMASLTTKRLDFFT